MGKTPCVRLDKTMAQPNGMREVKGVHSMCQKVERKNYHGWVGGKSFRIWLFFNIMMQNMYRYMNMVMCT
jgi:hypothetical protein